MLIGIGDQLKLGRYTVHSRFKRVVNFVQDDWLASLVLKSVGNGPLNIVVEGTVLLNAVSLVVEPEHIQINDNAYPIVSGARYCSSLQIPSQIPPAFGEHLIACRTRFLQQAHPLSLAFLLDQHRLTAFRSGFEKAMAEQINEGAAALFDGDILSGIPRVKGCGMGLTPAGDDLLAGLFAAKHLIAAMRGQDVHEFLHTAYLTARSRNLIADSALRMAAQGVFVEYVKRLMLSLLQGTPTAVCSAVDDVLLHGETSGADWLSGFLLTLFNEFEENRIAAQPDAEYSIAAE